MYPGKFPCFGTEGSPDAEEYGEAVSAISAGELWWWREGRADCGSVWAAFGLLSEACRLCWRSGAPRGVGRLHSLWVVDGETLVCCC